MKNTKKGSCTTSNLWRQRNKTSQFCTWVGKSVVFWLLACVAGQIYIYIKKETYILMKPFDFIFSSVSIFFLSWLSLYLCYNNIVITLLTLVLHCMKEKNLYPIRKCATASLQIKMEESTRNGTSHLFVLSGNRYCGSGTSYTVLNIVLWEVRKNMPF